MTTSEIKKMTVAERLKMMEDIWDTLCHEDEEIESPAWHEGILKERRDRIAKGEAEFISIDELKTKNKP